MDFTDEIKSFAKSIPDLSSKISTEEGTKNALIMPFIRLLGYDVFNPNEVNPEYIADVGTKKGEKVDYAIMRDNVPILLIECKPVSSDLSKEHASQLFRYFTVTPARVGILTNGIIYQFFTDLDSPNKMDEKPFLEINMLEIKDPLIEELKKFTKQSFNVDELDSYASQLKYTREIINILNSEFNSPSEEFVKFFAVKVYQGRLTHQAKDKFTIFTKNALSQFLIEKIQERFKSAMESEERKKISPDSEEINTASFEEEVITTDEEIHAYNIVKAILHEIVNPNRISIRDAKSYCPILFDNNNRKPICRFNFNTRQKTVSVFDNDEKDGIKIPINDLNEIFNLSPHFKNIVHEYLKNT